MKSPILNTHKVKSSILISMVCLSVLFSCSEEKLCLRGSGRVETHELQAGAFEDIYIYGPVNLRFKQSETVKLSVVAEPEMFSNLSYRIHDKSLFIGFEGNVSCFETKYGVWVDVSLPELKYINAQGNNEIISIGPIYQDRIKIVTDGIAKVQLAGSVQEQHISVSGSLMARNLDLLSARTSINIDGSGDLEISCSDKLTIDVKGAATIAYKGAPAIHIEKKGDLSLYSMD